MQKTLKKALVWFRRDLRVHDQAALYHALRAAEQVWCVFVFDRDILDALGGERPGSAAVAAFRALTMLDQGEAPAAVADLITVLLSRSGDADDEAYRAVLHGQVAELG